MPTSSQRHFAAQQALSSSASSGSVTSGYRLTPAQIVLRDSDYGREVWNWGSQNPWKTNGVRSMKANVPGIVFSDLTTDGKGNVLNMPLLRDRPCFGRIEVRLRNGRSSYPVTDKHGRVHQTVSRCGRCPHRSACHTLVKERIDSDVRLEQPIKLWGNQARDENGVPLCTGPGQMLWQEVKLAIIEVGRFTNSNDQRLNDVLADEAAEAAAKTRLNWRVNQQRQRTRERNLRFKAGGGLSDVEMAALLVQRDERIAVLKSIHGTPNLPKCISRIPVASLHRSAFITANASLAAFVLSLEGRNIGSGRIARWMVDRGLNDGIPYASLKARCDADYYRGRTLEDPIDGVIHWPRYDVDRDLDTASDTLLAQPE